MNHEVRHELSQGEAQAVARRVLESYVQRFARYSPEVVWRSESEAAVAFTAKGIRLRGGLVVAADRFELSLNVPLLLRPFQERALQVIEREVRKWLAPEPERAT